MYRKSTAWRLSENFFFSYTHTQFFFQFDTFFVKIFINSLFFCLTHLNFINKRYFQILLFVFWCIKYFFIIYIIFFLTPEYLNNQYLYFILPRLDYENTSAHQEVLQRNKTNNKHKAETKINLRNFFITRVVFCDAICLLECKWISQTTLCLLILCTF